MAGITSIKDVAKYAGVSVATVSRVINGRDRVKEETRTAILQAMQELHYHPNELARSLGKTRQTRLVALYSMSPYQPFFAELIDHIEEALSGKGYRLLLFTSSKDEVKDHRCEELINSQIIDGLIIGSYPITGDAIQQVQIPTVTVETMLSDRIPSVMSDNYQGGILGTRHLIARGSRNLVLINGCREPLARERKMDGRERGFVETCEKAQVGYRIYYPSVEMVQEMDYSVLVNQIFYECPQVDGILANSDVIAAEVVRIGAAQGYRVPEQLKVVGFDGTYISRIMNPPLTTVAQNIRELARQTVETLIAQIEKRPCSPKTVVPVNLIERQST